MGGCRLVVSVRQFRDGSSSSQFRGSSGDMNLIWLFA